MNEDIGTKIDEIYDAIKFHESELEALKEERNRLCAESVAQGSYKTTTGRSIRHRTRTSRNLNVEMFRLTDKELFDAFVNDGNVTFPAAVVRQLPEDKPYITTKTIEYYEVRE